MAKRKAPEWRRNMVTNYLDVTLIVFELILSALFILIGYHTGNIYFRGVGVGLIIAWVTSGVAYLYKRWLKS